jgi:HD-like signal output (HDOD) protein
MLQETIDDPLHTRQQLANTIAYDPALAARILPIANSAYYGFPATIDSVEAATSIVGEVDLRNLVLATSVVCSMSSLTYKGVNLNVFWLYSLHCGIYARLIAKNVDGCDAEILFLAESGPGVDPETDSQLVTLACNLNLSDAVLRDVCDAVEQQCDEV